LYFQRDINSVQERT